MSALEFFTPHEVFSIFSSISVRPKKQQKLHVQMEHHTALAFWCEISVSLLLSFGPILEISLC
jgi:hypothetical protein